MTDENKPGEVADESSREETRGGLEAIKRYVVALCGDCKCSVVIILLVLASASSFLVYCGNGVMDLGLSPGKVALYSGGLFLLLSFLYLFTGDICKTKMTAMVMYCYLLTGIALLGSVVPFMVGSGLWQDANKRFEHLPIKVIVACQEEPRKTKLPFEIACVDEADAADGQGKPNTRSREPNYQWVVSVGGSVVPGSPADGYIRISGGLVVPLYIIVLALMGGAVSMTRRVPEYQRRVWCWFINPKHSECEDAQGNPIAPDCDEREGSLEPPCVREYLVFQLMQVGSAPLIAVTAYYVFSPDGTAAAAVLGFASGFASETILLRIRLVAQGLMPPSKTKKGAGPKPPPSPGNESAAGAAENETASGKAPQAEPPKKN